MSWLAPVGVLLGIVLLMYLAWKGVNIIIIGPLTAVLIIITNGMPMNEALLVGENSYLAGLGSFVIKYFPIFIMGSLLGKYLEDSKATITIANNIFKLTGKDNAFRVLVAIAIISALLTYGGVSMFIVIFSIVAISRPIFEELNLPWHLVVLPMVLGAVTFTMVTIPGSPSIQNVIPTSLGTPLTAAPLMGIVCSIVVILYGFFYMKWQLNRVIATGEHYVEIGQVLKADVNPDELPSLIASILPMVVLLGIILIGSTMRIPNIIIPALLSAVIVAALVLYKHIPDQLQTINTGAISSILPIIFTAAAVGVGSVVVSAPGFKVLLGGLQALPGGMQTQITAITGFLALVTASASGALGIIIPMFGKTWIDAGLNPEVVHRLATITAGTFAAMPHSGFVFSCMAVFGLSHKQVYKSIFFIGFLGNLISLIVAVIMALLFY